MSDTPRVAVVGAGLAGLSAALALTRHGYDVELFERTRLLGGKVTSFVVEGVEVDNGQHVFLGCCSEFLDFAHQVGMSEQLHMQERFNVTVLSRDGRRARLASGRLPAPIHLVFAFAAYRHLSRGDKLRVARGLLAARRRTPVGGDMAAWLQRHGQTPATRRAFWDPFLVPALNAPLEAVSAADGLFVIRTAFLGSKDAARIGYMTVPLARLAEAAASRLHAVHTRTSVSGIDTHAGRVVALHLDNGNTVECDACVLAVPPRRLGSLLGDPDSYGVHGLDAFQTQPIVDVHLWYDTDVSAIDFAALLDSPVQWVFAKGPGYLCCSLSAAEQSVALPESELVALCHQELIAALPELRSARLVRGAATRDPEATFVPAPGLQRPGAATSLENLVVAGAWTDTGWPATMESAVRSGRTAAAQLIASRAAERAQPGRDARTVPVAEAAVV
jgi:squalene-associated FAD-dependent desaturase